MYLPESLILRYAAAAFDTDKRYWSLAEADWQFNGSLKFNAATQTFNCDTSGTMSTIPT
ncbi:hypothetical protein GCM10023155_50400 [Bremerella cremea]